MEEGRRPQRTTRFSGDFLKRFSNLSSDDEAELDDEERAPSGRKTKAKKAAPATTKKSRTKQCPGCGAQLPVSTKECQYCDNQFSSKSMLVSSSTAAEESQQIRDKFPFVPDREEDGSLIIQSILGRRLRKTGKRLKAAAAATSLSALDGKYDYEYLIKYKNMSYMHVQWLSATEIEAMNAKSKQSLNRYLTKLDRGDPGVSEDGEIEASYLEVEKLLDFKEEEVVEVVDEIPPPDPTELDSAEKIPTAAESSLAAAIAESKREVEHHSQEQGDGLEKSQENNEDLTDGSEDDMEQAKKNKKSTEAWLADDDDEIRSEEEEQAKSASQIFQGGERCRHVLEHIMKDPYAQSFIHPVDTEAFDDYLDVVGESVCLGDIKARLEAGEYNKYNQHVKFLNDTRVIWRNCKIYNIYKSQIWHCAHALSMLLERLYKAWVLSFADGSVPMSDPVGRPWEQSCRVCQKEEDDANMLLCDHCDASYHIYCLRPKLLSVPEEAWVCKRCQAWATKTGAKLLSAAAEDEARHITENAGTRKYVKMKKKKYLVKWRGLSYRECTWETPEDINDDAKIADFHRFNDSPPDEPPLTQAEISMELSKDKKFQIYPAMDSPNCKMDVFGVVLAQIRSLHFLKWGKTPPDALMKESGPASLSWVYGYRTAMALPSEVKELIKLTISDAEGEEGKNSLRLLGSADEEVKDPEEQEEGGEEATDQEVVTRMSWFSLGKTDLVKDEVTDILSAIVYSVARGDNLPPRPDLPPHHLEVRVPLDPWEPSLCMQIGDFQGKCVVSSFKRNSRWTSLGR